MRNLISRCLIVVALFASGDVLGQDLPVMPTPTAEQKWLEKFTGEWTTDSKGKMGPDQPEMECRGTLKSRSLGGFWVVNELVGDMVGEPMTGIQTIGYDEAKKMYVGTWVDSMSSFMWKYEGTVDKSGKTLTLEADGPNFIEQGTMTKFQDIYEFKSADEIIMSSRMLGSDGKWVTFMAGIAKRVKK